MTQSIFSIVTLFFLTTLYSHGTERLNEAERKLANSQNRYFEALLKGPTKTSEEAQRLRDQIVAPAYSEVNQVLNDQNKTFASQFLNLMSPAQYQRELDFADQQEAHSTLKDKAIRGVGEFVQTLFGDEEAGRGLAGNSSPGGGGSQTATGPIKPRVVIDGRNVPKVIEFPGTKKKARPE